MLTLESLFGHRLISGDARGFLTWESGISIAKWLPMVTALLTDQLNVWWLFFCLYDYQSLKASTRMTADAACRPTGQKFRIMSGVRATQIKNVLEATTHYIQKIAKTYNSMYTFMLTQPTTAFLATLAPRVPVL
jgi:hypothetical protein